jgi:hypothetical protein
MKHAFLSLLLASLASNVHAQEEQTFKSYCDKTEKIFNELRTSMGEQPLLGGRGPEGSTGIMTLWVNPSTRSWTILVTYPEKTCVIGGGSNITLRKFDNAKLVL